MVAKGIAHTDDLEKLSPETSVPISALSAGDSPRVNGEDVEHTGLLAQIEAKLPPIVVHRSTMRVIDGAHRLHAATIRGEKAIDVRFFDGTEADAFVLAVQLNQAHGLPLSLSDRKNAAARIVGSHPEWSNRRIAAATGLAANTVGAVRRRASVQTAQSDVRVGRDGRVRPTDIAAGRQRAGKLLVSDPNASLRQIAKAVGVSPATVSDVRARISRGEPAVTPRQRALVPAQRHEHQVAEVNDDERLEPASSLRDLRRDPSVRFTESGRVLLRLLEASAIEPQQWDQIVDSIPQHCQRAVVRIARDCAASWRWIAERLDQRLDCALADDRPTSVKDAAG